MSSQERGEALRRYPPLAGAFVAAVVAVFVLPSALNVPQSNPTQTLEFAPIPPEDEQPPPDESSNLESLSLGTTSTAPAGDGPSGASGPGLPPPAIPEGVGGRPISKRCVGNPPRQTEDPLSPPCVAHFEGENGGATAPGVSADEITVLFYLESGRCEGATSRGYECPEAGSLHDLSLPPDTADHSSVRILRAYLRHFNDRFQLYDRRVHGWVYFTGAESASPEVRRAEASNLVEKLRPFAVFPYALDFNDDFLDRSAELGVLNFGSFTARPAEFYRQHPGRVWSYLPSLDQQALVYSDFICTKVVPHPASFSGNADENGKPRKLGLLHPDDPSRPNLGAFARLVRQQVEACGGHIEYEATYPTAGNAFDIENQQPSSQNMAVFAQAGVTTILQTQGYDTWHTQSAGQLGYRPEWVVAGDGQWDGHSSSGYQEQSVWDHAWVITNLPLARPVEEQTCYRALSEGDPQMPAKDKSFSCSFRSYYVDLRMLFTGIQTAGPRLTVESLDQGLHAIPEVRSTDPSIPTCFFEPGDYTCVKDAAAGWWDSESATADGSSGCWRMAHEASRYFPGSWPPGDVLTMKSDRDPCNEYAGSISGG